MFGIKKEHLGLDPRGEQDSLILQYLLELTEDIKEVKHDLQQIKTSQRASQKRERKQLKSE